MGALQPWHLIIVLVIVMVLFGPGKLPQVGKAIGDSFRDFKRASSDDTHETSKITLVSQAHTCATCKAPLSAGARFCASCGASVPVP